MAVKCSVLTNPVYTNAALTGSTAVQSIAFNLNAVSNPQCCWAIIAGAGLTATFQVMVSQDNVTYIDSGLSLPSISGSAKNIWVEYDGGAPWALLQITPSSGTGSVVVKGSFKGNG